MHRDDLRKKLLAYHPVDLEEIKAREMILAFVDREPNCFERSCQEGHITGSAWLENYSGDRFLLTFHRKLQHWFQVGGHADGDSNVLNVALKEAKEESGLKSIEPVSTDIFDLSVHKYIGKDTQPHYHYDVRFYLKAVDPQESIQISEESIDVRWFDKVPDEKSFELVRMFNKWRSWHQTSDKR